MKIAYKVSTVSGTRSEDAFNETVTLSPVVVPGTFSGYPMITFPVEQADLGKFIPGDAVTVEITVNEE